jgi:hypothetical protein
MGDNGHSKHIIAALQQENHHLKQRLHHFNKENDELNADMAQLKKTNDRFEADLREVQKKSFKEMTKTTWTPLEDNAVRELLEEIHKDIEDWADENGVDSLENLGDCLDEAEAGQLMKALQEVSLTTAGDLDTQVRLWIESSLDPVLLLTALVTYHMYTSMCINPFLGLDAFGGEFQTSLVSQTMLSMYHVLLERKYHKLPN